MAEERIQTILTTHSGIDGTTSAAERSSTSQQQQESLRTATNRRTEDSTSERSGTQTSEQISAQVEAQLGEELSTQKAHTLKKVQRPGEQTSTQTEDIGISVNFTITYLTGLGAKPTL